MNIRYFEWRWEEDVVIEYRRDGECNGCGMCCMVRIQWDVSRPDNDPFIGWSPRNGNRGRCAHAKVSTAVLINNNHWRYFDDIKIGTEPEICGMLTADKRCKIHAGKALIASAWPMSPVHVEALSECSYTFEEIGRWKISELE